MASQGSDRAAPKYDRDFLLSPAKRNELIELWEVERYGRDCFGDPDHVHHYGMPPKEWWGRGMRILARSCIEAVKDPFGDAIGGDVAKVVARAPGRPAIGVVDPFAGSCNGLHAILRHLPAAKGIGFEIQQALFDLTTRNVARLNAPIDLMLGSYKDYLASRRHPRDHLIIAFSANVGRCFPSGDRFASRSNKASYSRDHWRFRESLWLSTCALRDAGAVVE